MFGKRININNTSKRKRDLCGGGKRRIIRNGCLQCVCVCVEGLNRAFKKRQRDASYPEAAALILLAQRWPLPLIHYVFLMNCVELNHTALINVGLQEKYERLGFCFFSNCTVKLRLNIFSFNISYFNLADLWRSTESSFLWMVHTSS